MGADGEPLFCLADICKVLELSNPSKVASQVCEEFLCPNLKLGHVTDSLGRDQEASFITEPQLYFVLMRSRSENARPFRQWVVNDVLPSIRKTGSYGTPQVALTELLEAAKLLFTTAGLEGNQLVLAMDKVTKAQTGVSLLAQGGVELVRPQQVLLATPTQLGAPLGLSAKAINQELKARGLQEKLASRWAPTALGLSLGAVLMDTGKRHSNGTPVIQLKWPINILEISAKS